MAKRKTTSRTPRSYQQEIRDIKAANESWKTACASAERELAMKRTSLADMDRHATALQKRAEADANDMAFLRARVHALELVIVAQARLLTESIARGNLTKDWTKLDVCGLPKGSHLSGKEIVETAMKSAIKASGLGSTSCDVFDDEARVPVQWESRWGMGVDRLRR